jgi:hypothetical protein
MKKSKSSTPSRFWIPPSSAFVARTVGMIYCGSTFPEYPIFVYLQSSQEEKGIAERIAYPVPLSITTGGFPAIFQGKIKEEMRSTR